jgi:hypothetical protein
MELGALGCIFVRDIVKKERKKKGKKDKAME